VISFSLAFMQSAQCHALPQEYICTISACLSCEGIAPSRPGVGHDRRSCALVLALSPSSSFKGVLRWLSTLFAETLRVAQQSAKDSIHCFVGEKWDPKVNCRPIASLRTGVHEIPVSSLSVVELRLGTEMTVSRRRTHAALKLNGGGTECKHLPDYLAHAYAPMRGCQCACCWGVVGWGGFARNALPKGPPIRNASIFESTRLSVDCRRKYLCDEIWHSRHTYPP